MAKRSIEDIKIAIKQLTSRVDFFEHYGMLDDAEAERRKLEALEDELANYGVDKKKGS